jgi:hypothetical protein
MTTPTFGTAKSVIPREEKTGRPLIVPPGGGEPIAYDRASKISKALDDGAGLSFWKQCMTLLGAAKSPTIIRAAKTMTYDENKREVMELCEQAMTLAGSSDKATDGTTMHTLTERIDQGQPLPDGLDEQTAADLAAYVKVTRGLTPVAVERFVVCDELRIAGTFDRLLRVEPVDWLPTWLHGRIVIGDLKTGNYAAAVDSIAQQLAIYARSYYYDPTTGERTPTGADQAVGLIVGLPFGQGKAEVIAVDLAVGWQGVLASQAAVAYRQRARLACKACDQGSGFYKNGNPCRSCKGVRREPIGVTVAAA